MRGHRHRIKGDASLSLAYYSCCAGSSPSSGGPGRWSSGSSQPGVQVLLSEGHDVVLDQPDRGLGGRDQPGLALPVLPLQGHDHRPSSSSSTATTSAEPVAAALERAAQRHRPPDDPRHPRTRCSTALEKDVGPLLRGQHRGAARPPGHGDRLATLERRVQELVRALTWPGARTCCGPATTRRLPGCWCCASRRSACATCWMRRTSRGTCSSTRSRPCARATWPDRFGQPK